MNMLEKLKQVDVRTVNREELIDVKSMEIEKSEGRNEEELRAEFVKRVKNPYCFLVGKVIVKSVFTEGSTINQRIEEIVLSK